MDNAGKIGGACAPHGGACAPLGGAGSAPAAPFLPVLLDAFDIDRIRSREVPLGEAVY
jgi:hypothetical protein